MEIELRFWDPSRYPADLPATHATAMAHYEAIRSEKDSTSVNQSFARFAQKLEARYSSRETVEARRRAGADDEVDDSPWLSRPVHDAQVCHSGTFALELDPYASDEVIAFVVQAARECGLIVSLNDAEVFFLPDGETLVPESMGGAAAVAQVEAGAAVTPKAAPKPKLSEVRKTFNARMKQLLEARGFRKVLSSSTAGVGEPGSCFQRDVKCGTQKIEYGVERRNEGVVAYVLCRVFCTTVEDIMRMVLPDVVARNLSPFTALLFLVSDIDPNTSTFFMRGTSKLEFLIDTPAQMDQRIETIEKHALEILDIGCDIEGLDSLLSGEAWGGAYGKTWISTAVSVLSE